MPGEAAKVELLHEGVGIALFHVPDAGLFPKAFEDHLGTDHSGHSSGVADGLTGDFRIALLVVAGIVDEDTLLLSVLRTYDVAADTGLTLCAWTQAGGVGEDGFEKLDWLDFLPLEVDGFD